MASTAFASALWFLGILATIPLALWLFKRSPAGARFAGTGQSLRHVAALPLSANQRIVTVEVGTGAARRWLVLGVTAQQISLLHSLAPQDDTEGAVPPTNPAGPAFAQFLGRLRPEKGSA